jgi:hypothetical protein
MTSLMVPKSDLSDLISAAKSSSDMIPQF